MVVDLPKMVRQVHREMHQEVLGRNRFIKTLHRTFGLQLLGSQLPKRGIDDLGGFYDLLYEFLPGNVFCGKFEVSISDIARCAQVSADKRIQVTYQMQAKVSRRIGNILFYIPDSFFLLVLFEF